MDWSIMHMAPGDFVQKALRNRRSDLLYETRFSGFKGYFYLHLEHQRRPHPDMPFRLLGYMVNIWEQHKKQYPKEPIPLIFPMVLYQGATSWKVSLSFHEFLEVPHALKPYVPNFTYSLMDLSKLSDEEIRRSTVIESGTFAHEAYRCPGSPGIPDRNHFAFTQRVHSKRNRIGISRNCAILFYSKGILI